MMFLCGRLSFFKLFAADSFIKIPPNKRPGPTLLRVLSVASNRKLNYND